MHTLVQEYLMMPFPRIAEGPYKYKNEVAVLMRRQQDFFAQMFIIEGQLLHLDVQAFVSAQAASTTTVVPPPKRPRGRPPTGGRKSKIKVDDEAEWQDI